MESELKAEVASALALLDDLSAKSSDSGLSEETCWELFGGPCPGALRKKIRPLEEETTDQELEEKTEDYSSALEMLATTEAPDSKSIEAAPSPQGDSLEDFVIVTDPNEAKTWEEENFPPSDEAMLTDTTPEKVDAIAVEKSDDSKVSRKSVDATLIIGQEESKSTRGSLKSDQITTRPEELEKLPSTTDLNIKISKTDRDSLKTQSPEAISKLDHDSAAMKTQSPEAISMKEDYDSVAMKTQSSKAISMKEDHDSVAMKTQSPEAILMAEERESIATKTQSQEVISKVEADDLSTKKKSEHSQTSSISLQKKGISPEALIRLEDYSLSADKKSEHSQTSKTSSTIGLQQTEMKSEHSQTSKLSSATSVHKPELPKATPRSDVAKTSRVSSPIAQRSSGLVAEKNQQTAPERVSNASTVTSIASIARSAKKMQTSSASISSKSKSSSSTYEEPPKPKYTSKKGDKRCNCRCCLERQIKQSHICCGGCLKSSSGCCQKGCKNAPESSDKFKINIYQDDSEQDQGCGKNCMKITSFSADQPKPNQRGCCNKRLQTSTMDMYMDTANRYVPCSTNPLYLNPIYMNQDQKPCREIIYSTASPRKITKNGRKCFEKYPTNEPKWSESSDTDDLVSEKNICGNKATPNLEDSLKEAFKNRRPVREAVSKFEEHTKCCSRLCGGLAQSNYSQPQKPRYTERNGFEQQQATEICACCSRPKQERMPHLPMVQKRNNW